MEDYIYYSGVPPVDGKYLYRMDEYDNPEEIEIIEGKAYKNGKQMIVCGFEWRKL